MPFECTLFLVPLFLPHGSMMEHLTASQWRALLTYHITILKRKKNRNYNIRTILFLRVHFTQISFNGKMLTRKITWHACSELVTSLPKSCSYLISIVMNFVAFVVACNRKVEGKFKWLITICTCSSTWLSTYFTKCGLQEY